MKLFMAFLLSAVVTAIAVGQGIPRDSWPTYNGDFSGKRYSSLSKVNTSTVANLGLAWTHPI